ncbi:MAG: type ISP restriction/modification enzyme [Cyanobacteriota bacterium]|nr:type ISP restriction/modification enzyme [Cyanobacteriota bacterium]
MYSNGVKTNRDTWVYNFSQQLVIDNMTRMINFYNQQVEGFQKYLKGKIITDVEQRKKQVESFINADPKKISWSRGLKNDLGRFINYEFSHDSVFMGIYRPYCKNWVYFNKYFTDVIPNLHFHDTSQCFPLYTYEKQSDLGSLFATNNTEEYTKKSNIPDTILKDFQKKYQDKTINKEDIFYYIYGVFHSPEYKQRFAADLKKNLPRIPYTKDFWKFSKAGKELAYWHLNYETIEPYELEEFKKDLFLNDEDYRVEKMTFGKNKNGIDKTIIIYNSKLTLSQIPLETYQYIVNGKSALEWVIERYKITKDKNSGIVNDPNNWSEDSRYIVNLVKKIVRVSLETVKIVNNLPGLNERK